MKLITSGQKLSTTLVGLINQHDRIRFAVAWAGHDNNVYKALLENKSKIRKSVIGMNGYITTPKILGTFTDSKKVRFALNDQGVFHPKVYLFKTGKDWDLIIGSANMTNGGFNKNTEIMLHVSSDDAKKKIHKKSANSITAYWEKAETMTQQKAADYSALYKTNRAKNPNHFSKRKKKGRAPINTKILPMTWNNFYSTAIADKEHTIEGRLDLLNSIKDSFTQHPSLSEMSPQERRVIAGLSNELNSHTAWFGSMERAAHTHGWAAHIDENNLLLSEALDNIPQSGSVSRTAFHDYTEGFRRACPKSKNAIGTFTRLLAMKRPDTFVCLTTTNNERLCEDFGISKSTMTYEKYWDEIIERIAQSVWWNADKPKNVDEMAVWLTRAAMLDAIYYTPS